jgi:hypothetical protein
MSLAELIPMLLAELSSTDKAVGESLVELLLKELLGKEVAW